MDTKTIPPFEKILNEIIRNMGPAHRWSRALKRFVRKGYQIKDHLLHATHNRMILTVLKRQIPGINVTETRVVMASTYNDIYLHVPTKTETSDADTKQPDKIRIIPMNYRFCLVEESIPEFDAVFRVTFGLWCSYVPEMDVVVIVEGSMRVDTEERGPIYEW